MTAVAPEGARQRLLEALILAPTGEVLLERLRQGLGDEACVWLADSANRLFYAARAPDASSGELTWQQALDGIGPGRHLCVCEGEPVALLDSADPFAAGVAECLGPILVQLFERETSAERLRFAERKNRLIIEAGRRLRGLDFAMVAVRALETATAAVEAEVGALLISSAEGLRLQASFGLDQDHINALRGADGRRVVDVCEAQVETLVLDPTELSKPQTAADLSINRLLAIPLVAPSAGDRAPRTLGVMLLVVTHTRLAESDRELAELACGIAAVALDEVHRAKEWLAHEQARSEGELERRVQRQMLPAEDLMLAELAVSGHSRPCEGTGGDYYQFTRVGSEVFAAIGDVSGHGFASALYTTMAHTALLQAVHLRPLDAMFAELSDHLCRYAVDGKYMTAFAALLNPVTGRLRWTNAGHNPVLLVRADGTAAWLEAQGIPLGMFEGATYPIQELTLAADDCLIMFTDGIVEASVDGQEYGDARLERIAIANRAASSRALATALFTDFDRFLEGTSAADDASVVVMKMASAR